MSNMERTLQIIWEHLPAAGTELGAYTFLAADRLWTGETGGVPYAAVAEDRWPSNKGGYFLAVTAEGAVYVSDLDSGVFTDYCAAGFPQFMEIMNLCQTALETAPSPDEDDEEAFQELEQTLRQEIMEIDPTAVEDPEGFWSTWLGELGNGMI